MDSETKKLLYKEATEEINSLLAGEKNMILKMSSINSILKNKFDYYFWVGFYIVDNNELIIGPYQGTVGCTHIAFERGICGRAAKLQATQIVENVHLDSEHIACDSRSNSEIVLPVFNSEKELIAVFDIDSTEFSSFDLIDKEFLEIILLEQFSKDKLVYSWNW